MLKNGSTRTLYARGGVLRIQCIHKGDSVRSAAIASVCQPIFVTIAVRKGPPQCIQWTHRATPGGCAVLTGCVPVGATYSRALLRACGVTCPPVWALEASHDARSQVCAPWPPKLGHPASSTGIPQISPYATRRRPQTMRPHKSTQASTAAAKTAWVRPHTNPSGGGCGGANRSGRPMAKALRAQPTASACRR